MLTISTPKQIARTRSEAERWLPARAEITEKYCRIDERFDVVFAG
jgi:hypothetical protein